MRISSAGRELEGECAAERMSNKMDRTCEPPQLLSEMLDFHIQPRRRGIGTRHIPAVTRDVGSNDVISAVARLNQFVPLLPRAHRAVQGYDVVCRVVVEGL